MKLKYLFWIGFIFGIVIAPILYNHITIMDAATITRGTTFASTDLVTAARLHALVDNATITLVASDIPALGANTVTSTNVVDGSLTGVDMANRTITTLLYGTNSVDGIALATNIIFNAGILTFSNSNVNLTFSSNQINWAAVSGVTNSTGSADSGKVVKLNPSGVLSTSLYTQASFTSSFTSTNIVITSAGSVINAHSLGGMPTLIQCRIVCTSGNNNYSINDEVIVQTSADGGLNAGVSIVPDASNLNIRFGQNPGGCIAVLDKTTGVPAAIDNTKWVFVIRAWK